MLLMSDFMLHGNMVGGRRSKHGVSGLESDNILVSLVALPSASTR